MCYRSFLYRLAVVLSVQLSIVIDGHEGEVFEVVVNKVSLCHTVLLLVTAAEHFETHGLLHLQVETALEKEGLWII